jgi:hypothetical protein
MKNNQPVLLGIEYPNEASPKRAPFYSNTVSEVLIPSDKLVILSGEPDGTGTTYVDDQATITVNGVEVYKFDYSHGNSGRIIPAAPVDLTGQFKQFSGQRVEITITYTDLFGGSQGASSFFLVFL